MDGKGNYEWSQEKMDATIIDNSKKNGSIMTVYVVYQSA